MPDPYTIALTPEEAETADAAGLTYLQAAALKSVQLPIAPISLKLSMLSIQQRLDVKKFALDMVEPLTIKTSQERSIADRIKDADEIVSWILST